MALLVYPDVRRGRGMWYWRIWPVPVENMPAQYLRVSCCLLQPRLSWGLARSLSAVNLSKPPLFLRRGWTLMLHGQGPLCLHLVSSGVPLRFFILRSETQLSAIYIAEVLISTWNGASTHRASAHAACLCCPFFGEHIHVTILASF